MTVGIVPAQIAPFVVARIGYAQARRLATYGLRLDAEDALRIGLVHEVADNHGELLAKGAAAVNQVLRCSPQAVAETKQLVRASVREPLGPRSTRPPTCSPLRWPAMRARASAPSSRSASRRGSKKIERL